MFIFNFSIHLKNYKWLIFSLLFEVVGKSRNIQEFKNGIQITTL